MSTTHSHLIHRILIQCTQLSDDIVRIVGNYWKGVIMVYNNCYAFAFHMTDGTVVTCGHAGWGGDNKHVYPRIKNHGVEAIFSNDHTFIAKLFNGSTIHWGHSICVHAEDLANVDTVVSNRFSIAIKSIDKRVRILGKVYNRHELARIQHIKGVKDIVATSEAFAITFQDSHAGIIVYGHHKFGGKIDTYIQQSLQSKGVEYVIANDDAFAACLKNGDGVEVWGRLRYGGILTIHQRSYCATHRVIAIYNTKSAFVARFSDGSVLTWGHPRFGGNNSNVQTELKQGSVGYIVSTDYAFTAVMNDKRSIVTWGGANMLGTPISLNDSIRKQVSMYGIYKIHSTSSAFVAILENGDLVTWGDVHHGGLIPATQEAQLQVGVEYIVSNYGAFVAKLSKRNGVVAWGDSDCGGTMSIEMQQEIKTKGVDHIYATKAAFAVTLLDGSAKTWGSRIYGGNSDNIRETLIRGYSTRI